MAHCYATFIFCVGTAREVDLPKILSTSCSEVQLVQHMYAAAFQSTDSNTCPTSQHKHTILTNGLFRGHMRSLGFSHTLLAELPLPEFLEAHLGIVLNYGKLPLCPLPPPPPPAPGKLKKKNSLVSIHFHRLKSS